MIKNEKITKILCKHFLPEGKTKVNVGDVMGISLAAVILYGCLTAVASLIVYSIGDLICDILFEYTATTYLPVDKFIYGIGTISSLIYTAHVIHRLCIIELAECPLQKVEDETEETE